MRCGRRECGQPVTWKYGETLNVDRNSRVADSRVKDSDVGILEVWNSLSHASNPSNEVAMGDHDALGDASGATGVHDDCDV